MFLFCPIITFSSAPVIILHVSGSTRMILLASWSICSSSSSHPEITSSCPLPLIRMPTPLALQLPQSHHLSGHCPQPFWLSLFFRFQYFFILSHQDLHNTVSVVTVHFSHFFFPGLVRYSWHVALCKFKIYNVLIWYISVSSFQSLSRVQLYATPWIAAHQASLSITNSWILLKLMPIELVMPSSHLILCHPLLLLPPTPPSIRVFSNESTLRMR